MQVAVPLLICGLLAACVFQSHRLPEPWNYTSDAMGFTYTAAWSISFYPQLLLNFKRRCAVLQLHVYGGSSHVLSCFVAPVFLGASSEKWERITAYAAT